MNFGEMIAIVASKTKRPDKLSDIKTAINAAIAFFSTANFPHDRVDLDLTISSSEYTQSFDITVSPFTRFKKIDYIRPAGYHKYLDWRDPKKVFQEGRECLDVWHRSGNNIVFKISRLQSTLKVGYFQYHAVITADATTDWILDEMATAVEDFARSRILEDIGETTESARYFARALLFWEIFKGQTVEVSG